MNIPILTGTGFIVFGIIFFIHALANYKNAIASRSWPSVQGSVVNVKLWGKRRIGDEMHDVERLTIKYEYCVEGRLYAGSRVAFYTLVYPETYDFAKKYSQDSIVAVHYDSLDPSRSVLFTGPKESKRYSEFLISCLGILIGFVVVILNW